MCMASECGNMRCGVTKAALAHLELDHRASAMALEGSSIPGEGISAVREVQLCQSGGPEVRDRLSLSLGICQVAFLQPAAHQSPREQGWVRGWGILLDV